MSELTSQWLQQLQATEASGNPLRLAATRFGPVFVRAGDIIGDHMIQHGAWDYFLYAAIEEFADRNGIAIDVGAQFGTVSCMMSSCFSKVIAIEPNVDNFRILSLNTIIRPNIVPINACIYDRRATMSLSRTDEQDIEIPLDDRGRPDFSATDNVGSFSFSENGTGINTIHAFPLDDLNLDDVAVIKIDAQGADGRVILGAKETIRRCRPAILFEWETQLSGNYNVSLDTVRGLLGAMDYTLEVLYSNDSKQTDYIARPRG